MKDMFRCTLIVAAIAVWIGSLPSQAQHLSSSPFCDSFEDGAGFSTRWTADRSFVEPIDTAYSGNSALAMGGPADSCLAWIYRSGFEAAYGEYSGWFYQTNTATGAGTNGGGVHIQVQDDSDEHPQYRPGYGVSINAADSDNPQFSLLRFDGACPDGCYKVLASIVPDTVFISHKWVRIVVRRLPGGVIVAGYDFD
jgi:hypothetical protein